MKASEGQRIFVDVGAHVGETLEEAISPRWGFDRIYCFEPATSNLDALAEIADDRVIVVAAGWWHEDACLEIHDPGDIGASVYAAKARSDKTEKCLFIDASDWLEKNTTSNDEIWVKLNCEGAECTVIEHLDRTGVLARISHLMVHFDIEKVPGHAGEAGSARALLEKRGVETIEGKDILFGRSHAAKTENWLEWTTSGRLGKFRAARVRRYAFRLRQLLYPIKVRFLKKWANASSDSDRLQVTSNDR